MRSSSAYNGYMTLKIELLHTKISRTIVVPDHMTLEDLNAAVQAVMGWENEHQWMFTDNKRDGIIYELPNENRGGALHPFSRRLILDASKVLLRKALPDCGAKLLYEYDFGDSWKHLITRKANPKASEIACVKSQGPDGIEDFGGAWRLAAFIEAMRNDPEDKEYAETLEWMRLKTPDDVRRYLNGDTVARKTELLKHALVHVRQITHTNESSPPPMTEEEMANKLGFFFAMCVSERIWTILEEALRNDGTCEFEDSNRVLAGYFLTMFEGLKVKNGQSSLFHTEPSRLTVLPEWVKMYKTYGENWHNLHEQCDILEEYASSVVHLYGVVSIDELHGIVKRYDPNSRTSTDDLLRLLKARCVSCPGMPFRISDEFVVSEVYFPNEIENVDDRIEELRKVQANFSRWYPPTRDYLFLWKQCDEFIATPESDKVEALLKTACRDDVRYDFEESLFAIYQALEHAIMPEALYDLLLDDELIPELAAKQRRELLEAMDEWNKVIHMPSLNGNTLKDLREKDIEISCSAEPKVGRNSPCPCGSGKKYKHCCGR